MRILERLGHKFPRLNRHYLDKEIPFKSVDIERATGEDKSFYERVALEQLASETFAAQQFFPFIEAMMHLIGAEQRSEPTTVSRILRDTENNMDISFMQTLHADCGWSTVVTYPALPGSTQEENDRAFARYEWPFVGEDVGYSYYQKIPKKRTESLSLGGQFNAVLPPLLLPPSHETLPHISYLTGEIIQIPLHDAKIYGDLSPTNQTMKQLCGKLFSVYQVMG